MVLERRENGTNQMVVAEKLPPGQLYGEGLKSRKVPGLILSERSYPPWFKTPTHSHGNPLFCLVIQGAYTENFDVKTRECEPSTLLFHPADEQHQEHFHSSGGHSFIIEMEPWWLDRLRQQAKVLSSAASFNGGSPSLLGMRLYKEFLEIEDDLSPLVIEGLTLAMVGEASRRATKPSTTQPPRWLSQVKELLHDRFAKPLSLSDIAEVVGVHPVHLSQAFHKYYNCTIGGYIRRRRLEFACQKLATSNMPLCQIAVAAGFSDQSHFTRTFKRYMGMPPGQYRDLFA
jgi:AraC family transcriptional regulator